MINKAVMQIKAVLHFIQLGSLCTVLSDLVDCAFTFKGVPLDGCQEWIPGCNLHQPDFVTLKILMMCDDKHK